ncbi:MULTISPECIES: TspO/MBR family protein [Pacificimonas]|nr:MULTISPECIES: TspO/MBR family protein [Pacificimonas]
MTRSPTPSPPASSRRPMLIGALIVLVLGSAIGLAVQTGEGGWYEALTKPALTPPDYLFGIVWPVLYLLIGAAAGRIWARRGHPLAGRALFWFALQLGLNLAWTPVFFGLQQVELGLGVILALNVAAIWTTVRFGRIDRTAALLMLPYLVWIAFAAVLTFRIWQLNPALPTFI